MNTPIADDFPAIAANVAAATGDPTATRNHPIGPSATWNPWCRHCR